MTEEDIPQAVEIEKLCFSEPWTEGSYRSCFLRDGTQSWFYAAVREDCPEELLGIVGLSRMGDDGEIANVAVRPQTEAAAWACTILPWRFAPGTMRPSGCMNRKASGQRA